MVGFGGWVAVQMMVVVVEGRKEIKRMSFSHIQYCIYPHSQFI